MAPEARNGPVSDEALDLLGTHLDAMVRGDAGALRATMTPAAVLTHMTGYEQTADDWCQEVGDGTMRYHAIDLVSSDAEPDADGVRVRARTRTEATIWGHRSTWRLALDMRVGRDPDGIVRIRSTRASTW